MVTEDTGTVSPGGEAFSFGERFDTLPFPLGVPNISPLESNLKRVSLCLHACLSRRNVMKPDHGVA